MVDAKVLFDEGCDHDWKSFKVKNLKNLQRKTLENLEKIFLQFNQPDMDYQLFSSLH